MVKQEAERSKMSLAASKAWITRKLNAAKKVGEKTAKVIKKSGKPKIKKASKAKAGMTAEERREEIQARQTASDEDKRALKKLNGHDLEQLHA